MQGYSWARRSDLTVPTSVRVVPGYSLEITTTSAAPGVVT